MEKLHYGRVSAAGWLFVITVLVTLWASDAPEWDQLSAVVVKGETTALLAVITAVAGLGGPPAVGLIFDRLAALILYATRRSMWGTHFNQSFGDLLETVPQIERPVSSPGAFHAFLYTYADSRLIDWMRRRTTYAYSSVVSSIAIVSGLGLAGLAFRAFSLSVFLVSIALVATLVYYTHVVTTAIVETGQAWVSTIGRLVVKQFAGDLLDASGDRSAPRPREARSTRSKGGSLGD